MNTRTTHTPGPWRAEITPNAYADGGWLALVCGNYDKTGRFGDSLAQVTTHFSEGGRELPDAEWIANARLLAAAPALLEALEATLNTIGRHFMDYDDSDLPRDLTATVDQARAAIKAARNE